MTPSMTGDTEPIFAYSLPEDAEVLTVVVMVQGCPSSEDRSKASASVWFLN